MRIPAQADFPAVGLIQSTDSVEQRGFARTRWPGQADEFAGLDGDIDVIETGDDFIALSEGFAKLLTMDCAHSREVRLCSGRAPDRAGRRAMREEYWSGCRG